MHDIVHAEYKQTGQSKSTNKYGMREMPEKAFEARCPKPITEHLAKKY